MDQRSLETCLESMDPLRQRARPRRDLQGLTAAGTDSTSRNQPPPLRPTSKDARPRRTRSVVLPCPTYRAQPRWTRGGNDLGPMPHRAVKGWCHDPSSQIPPARYVAQTTAATTDHESLRQTNTRARTVAPGQGCTTRAQGRKKETARVELGPSHHRHPSTKVEPSSRLGFTPRSCQTTPSSPIDSSLPAPLYS